MRGLLFNPWIYDFKAFDFWNKPVGLLTVASLLRRCGFEIDFVDCLDRHDPAFPSRTRTDAFGRGKYENETIERPAVFSRVPRRYKRYGIPRPAVVEILRRLKPPDLILVTSGMTYWYQGVFDAIKLLRQIFPGREIILGGIYATLCPDHARRESGADAVLPGPAETSLLPYLQQRGYIQFCPDFSEPAPPDYSFYSRLSYGVVMPSRGCPFNCSYCATRVLAPSFQALPMTNVLQQILLLADRTNNIAFFDDALLCHPEFSRLLKAIIDANRHLFLHSANGLHCRFLTPDIVRLMKSAGFQTVYLSLETTDPARQAGTGGKVFTSEFLQAVKMLKTAGFSGHSVHAYLLFGLPGQTPDEIIQTIKFCHDQGVQPHLCEFSPIPGTVEYNKTGLAANADPLLHNNYYHTWHVAQPDPLVYRRIKDLLKKDPKVYTPLPV